jgi:hypothetical protein
MKRMMAVFGMVALVFTMISVLATVPASAQVWSGKASASGGTQTWGEHYNSSWSAGGCGSHCGGRTSSGLSAGNSTGNEAWVEGSGKERRVDRVQFWGEASRTDRYENNVRSRNGGVFTSGTGSVNVGVSGDSGRR